MGRLSTIAERTRRVVNTRELKALLDVGTDVQLPQVVRPDDAVLGTFPAGDVSRLDVVSSDNPIISIEEVGEEEVACIMVDDPSHMYLTDDFIPTHNTSNIIFLKSTDDAMIDTMVKMSGVLHKVYKNSKTVTKDVERVMFQNEGKMSITMSVEEEAVIQYNDFATLPPRNSIVLRAGDFPVWNRNETALPMSFMLLDSNKIIHPGHEYSLQTIPTLSSALEFDVRMNQPDFTRMLDRRVLQAERAEMAREFYKAAYGYKDIDIERMDPDTVSDEIMTLIDAITWEDSGSMDPEQEALLSDLDPDDMPDLDMITEDYVMEDNDEAIEDMASAEAKEAERTVKRWAGNTIALQDLVNRDGSANMSLAQEFVEAYQATKSQLIRDKHFRADDDALIAADGTVLISHRKDSEDLQRLREGLQSDHERVYAESEEDLDEEVIGQYEVQPELMHFLAEIPDWRVLANGVFERAMQVRMVA